MMDFRCMPRLSFNCRRPKIAHHGKRKMSTNGEPDDLKARVIKFAELVAATNNFHSDHFLGDGFLGKVYKGVLKDTNEIVTVKQLVHYELQEIGDFVAEALTISKVDHPNVVKLLGYCAEGDHRLLVYEYMPLGSLKDHLDDIRHNKLQLDWNSRMQIAAGVARCLEYLHDKMIPPVVHRNLKSSNIFLTEGYVPKLSDFGLTKVGPDRYSTKYPDETMQMGEVSGYIPPDYHICGKLTCKSDIFSFGILLLEIITGKKAFDRTRDVDKYTLESWAEPLLRDTKKFEQIADPALRGQYPKEALCQAVGVAFVCANGFYPNSRPCIAAVVEALNYIACPTNSPTNPNPRNWLIFKDRLGRNGSDISGW